MLNMDKFGKLITDKRRKAGLTQESFAAQLGITPQAVSKWENGLTYPDVTLFPQIAQILNVPIATLFGEDLGQASKQTPDSQRIGSSYRSAPLIYHTSSVACYSTKAVMKIDEEARTVYFTDGSYCDLSKRIAKNCGAGEIYVRKIEHYDHDDGISADSPDNIAEELSKFHIIRLSISCSCDVHIKEGKSRQLLAKGSKRFIDALKYRVENNELCIDIRPKNNNQSLGTSNKIDIITDFSHGTAFFAVVNGSALCKCEPSFETASISVNGSGDIDLSQVNELRTTVNGSGDVDVKSVTRRSDITVNGSGDVRIDSAKDTHLHVNGAGNIKIADAKGELHIKVAGSADVSAAGEVGKLYCSVSGSGDIKCGSLTVGEAEIYAENSADIHIGRIIRSSTEKLGNNAELKVDKRG